MAVTIGGDTYGFWDLGIIGAAGNTEYVAAYKGDRCLFYEEKVQPGSTPFDEDVTCRGSAWAGNVTLKEEVEFGYGTKAERWAGTIVDDEKNEYGGLPPGTESLVDLQRNPDDQGEVRLLYHRVVAPTNGVLGWASGDSLSFDLVFTNLDMMAANDVLDLVKVPSICEVMAGEFHDQQARDNAGGAGGGEGRERSRRALLPSPETTRSRTPASTSSLSLPSRGNEHTETGRKESWSSSPRAAVAEEEGSENMHQPSVPLRTPVGRRREENRKISGGDIAAGRRGGIGAVGIGSEGYRNLGDMGGDGGRRGGLRGLLAAVEQQEEEEEEEGRGAEGGRGRSFVSGDDGRDDAWLTSPGGVPAGESDAYGEGGGRGGEGRPESEEAATAGLLPIHLLLRSLGRQGYRRRG
ncbi:unnamed protein product [Ectocarpus sp. 12 AP-2014]